jgi:glycosyltransferase involved in cell wall biosynthesis
LVVAEGLGNGPLLTVAIPTVASREDWLRSCLDSIFQQAESGVLEIIVSGNGTRSITREIAENYGVRFIHHPVRLSAADHYAALIDGVEAKYVWLLGDDDLLEGDSVPQVLQAIRSNLNAGTPLDALVGRARMFADPSLTGMSEPIPEAWKPGRYSDLAGLADATGAQVHHGAFILRRDRFTLSNYWKYAGTAHEIFGAFWEGLAAAERLEVQVLPETLVLLRQAEKEWDHSKVRTYVGFRRYLELLPESVAQYSAKQRPPLSVGEALRVVAACPPEDRQYLQDFVSWHSSVGIMTRIAASVPAPVARAILNGREKLRLRT